METLSDSKSNHGRTASSINDLRKKSIEWRNRAEETIAHGCLTNSKRPESHVEGIYPSHLESARSCYTTDVDGLRYVDFICGLGAIITGHLDPRIAKAITKQLSIGTCLSLSSRLEVEYAELVHQVFPYMEKLRFLKTGSEACSAAIRIARAYTGRTRVLSEGYHGWHDEFTSLTPPALGVLDGDRYDIGRLFDHSDVIQYSDADPRNRGPIVPAAIIVEPVITDYSRERQCWLSKLRDTCTKHGIILIYDETITGLRFHGLSVANDTGVHPDISIMGKAMGGGLPLSIVGGRRDIMESDYFVSSTFAGEQLALAAALELLTLFVKKTVDISSLWEMGKDFQKRFNQIEPAILKIEGYPTRAIFKGAENTEHDKALFFQETCKAGILFGPSFFLMEDHRQEIDNVLDACTSILKRIKAREVKLQGNLPKKAFAQRVRNQ